MLERTKSPLASGEVIVESERYLVYPGFVFDREDSEIHVGDRIETLKKKEAQILEFMYVNKGTVMSRSEIYMGVWGAQLYISRTVDVHMSSLRRKIYGKGSDVTQTPLRTIRGVGYLLVEPND